MISPEAVVTFERPDGFRIVKSFGLARGDAICPRSLLRSTFRSIGAFIGLAPIDFLTDAERARNDCLSVLLACASKLGANGVVGLQFEAHEESDGSTRVSAFGEAVLLEPEPTALP
ncbi:MAG: heavy metal-binding domain-containing protein [Vulcanimicrobiaceae bacterium]